MKEIEFTQYLMPNGRQKTVYFPMPEGFEDKVKELIDAGCYFEVEMLSTGIVSLTCGFDGEDFAIELSENNKMITGAVTKLIETAYQDKKSWKKQNGD